MTRVLLASGSAIARTVQVACDGHSISVLVARDAREGLMAIRESHSTNEHIRIGAVVIDLSARTVRRGLHRVHLRPMEYQLLLALVRHRGVPLSRNDLLREVWLREPDGRGRTVDTHVASLRQKLGWDARASHRIVTVFNEGYMLTAD